MLGIFIADVLQLQFKATAGVIGMLSLMTSRKQSIKAGAKQFLGAVIGIVMSVLLFSYFGHELWVLGAFMIVFLSLLAYFNVREAMAGGTVLITQIFTSNMANTTIIVNEIALLSIGIGIAWILNLHMLDIESEIKDLQLKTEASIRTILKKMSLQLYQQYSLKDQEDQLAQLNRLIHQGIAKATQYNDNFLFKDNNYYLNYFDMRRDQYSILKHMQNHFKITFVEVDRDKTLGDYLVKVAEELNECNDAMELMTEWHKIKEHYEATPLPVNHEEFESRAVFFQFMNDIAYFKKIKMVFVTQNGGFKYCEK